MKRRINIAVVPPVLLPNTLVHVATEYKVSKDMEILEARLAFVENIKSTRFTDATI